jgi:hypothetical protein
MREAHGPVPREHPQYHSKRSRPYRKCLLTSRVSNNLAQIRAASTSNDGNGDSHLRRDADLRGKVLWLLPQPIWPPNCIDNMGIEFD